MSAPPPAPDIKIPDIPAVAYHGDGMSRQQRRVYNPDPEKIKRHCQHAPVVCHDGIDEKTGQRVRIVHISDTHNKHWMFLNRIPPGDILIHTGDFSKRMRADEVDRTMADFNAFLQTLPHQHKIVISGNHEIGLNGLNRSDIQNRLPACTYLQDTSITIHGIKFYGTPWTSSCRMGFSASHEQLQEKWRAIPDDTDVLLTHMPPFMIMDLAWQNRNSTAEECKYCGKSHRNYRHWGNYDLRQRVLAMKPKAHLYGHVHDDVGIKQVQDVVFINSAMDIEGKVAILDYYISGTSSQVGKKKKCTVQ